MIEIAEKRLVWFNASQVGLYEELAEKKLISVDFATFVKTAFHKEVDNIRKKEVDKNGECSSN